MSYIIELINISKSFSNTNVFSDVTIKIPQNIICVLTGKNGSGKTTLLRIIAGILLPDTGTVLVNNLDTKKYRNKIKTFIGLVTNQEHYLYPQLTILENLKFLSRIYQRDIKEISWYIDHLSINRFLTTKFCFCSSGIKHRVAILASLIHQPQILLIDELTKSVDYETATKIYELIKLLVNKNRMTILFVSHNISEIKSLAQYHLNIEDNKVVVK